jgi:hypothetical protein
LGGRFVSAGFGCGRGLGALEDELEVVGMPAMRRAAKSPAIEATSVRIACAWAALTSFAAIAAVRSLRNCASA